MIGSETHKIKSDSEKGLGFEVSTVDHVVKPASGLSNMGSEAKSGFGNEEAEELGNKLIVIMCGALISSLCISPCFSTSLEMVNALTLKLSDIHPSVNFETISSIAKEGVVFKIDPNKKNCNCSLELLELKGWVHLVEYRVVFLLRTRIYLLVPMVLGEISVCHYHLKCLCRCLNMVLYLDNQVLWDWITQVWERQEKLDYFLVMEEGCQYFLEDTTLF